MYVLLLLVFDFVFLNSFEMRLEMYDRRFVTFHAAFETLDVRLFMRLYFEVKEFNDLTANWKLTAISPVLPINL